MKTVEFNRMMAPYCRGDVAKLDDAAADKALRGGYAVQHDPRRGQVTKAPETTPPPSRSA